MTENVWTDTQLLKYLRGDEDACLDLLCHPVKLPTPS